eukprot:9483967-Pyramimonas_sp.AAC.1
MEAVADLKPLSSADDGPACDDADDGGTSVADRDEGSRRRRSQSRETFEGSKSSNTSGTLTLTLGRLGHVESAKGVGGLRWRAPPCHLRPVPFCSRLGGQKGHRAPVRRSGPWCPFAVDLEVKEGTGHPSDDWGPGALLQSTWKSKRAPGTR